MKTTPPKFATRLLHSFLRDDLVEEVSGDLEEKFTAMCKHSVFKAKVNYWFQVINYVRPFAIRKTKSLSANQTAMLKSYFKVGFRNLRKNVGYSIINIGGLASGMAIAILIGFWVYDELSFDEYHDSYERIVQVYQHQTINGRIGTKVSIPRPLEVTLRNNYGSDFTYISMSSWSGDHLLAAGENKFTKTGSFVQVDFPKIMTLRIRKGTIEGLRDQSSIMLSASAASSLFADKDPINQTVRIDGTMDAKVTAVYDDLPENSTFSGHDFFSSWELLLSVESWMREAETEWGNNSFQLFAQLAPGADINRVTEKIKKVKLIADPDEAKYNPEIILAPMSNWHLRSEWKDGKMVGGKIQMVWLFGIIGIFVVLLACINFMNLSTARSERRAKEVGIRMTLGSVRRQLIFQFLSESFLVVSLSFVLALLIVAVSFPAFNSLADKRMVIDWSIPMFWCMGAGFVVVTSLLAGSYPALYLSSFLPVKVLKGSFKAGRFSSLPRKALVVVQFTISVTLIIGTVVVYNQILFSKNRPIGYSQDGLVTIKMKSPDFAGKYNLIRDELKELGVVEEFAESSSPLTDIWSNNGGFRWAGKDPNVDGQFATIRGTHDYGSTIKWKIKRGRDFSREFSTDSSAIVINESAERFIGVDNAVGMEIIWGRHGWGPDGDRKYHVIGVAEDMIMTSPYIQVKPGIYFLGYENLSWMIMKLSAGRSTHESLSTIESVLKKHITSAVFDYKFVDDAYGKKFDSEEKIGKLASVFATLAIVISCLGLFGLASFVTEQRTKEIGIRKVMGASVNTLWHLLSKDFVLLVTLSCAIALPTSWFLLKNWLSKYEYHTEMSWWMMVVSCLGALVITLATVSFQSIKAALMNPVNSLRSE